MYKNKRYTADRPKSIRKYEIWYVKDVLLGGAKKCRPVVVCESKKDYVVGYACTSHPMLEKDYMYISDKEECGFWRLTYICEKVTVERDKCKWKMGELSDDERERFKEYVKRCEYAQI